MTALAPSANAMSEQEIQHNCDQANGDYYSTGVAEDGHTYSVCCYHDTMTHQNLCMSFMDGEYTETDPAPAKGSPPLPRPVRPPANNAPIQTSPSPEAPPPAGPKPVTGDNPPVAPPITNPPPVA